MRVSLKEKTKQFWTIYLMLTEHPRVTMTDLSEEIGATRKTTNLRLEEAYEKGHIVGPHLRKKSYKNFIEYVYLVDCKDALEPYLKYVKDQRISYHVVMDGFANLLVVSKEKIIIEGDVLVAGPRSDYHMSFPPDHSWDTAVEIMRKKVEDFNQKKYEPQGIIENYWNKTIEWDKEDELLFRKLKYDLRKPLTPIRETYGISAGKTWNWLDRLPKTCNILTQYFPETISAYDPYIFMFKTDYEDFIIDLFSKLPTSCLFFKVSDRLVLLAYMRRNLLRSIDQRPSNINKLQVPLLIRSLAKKGIVQKKDHAIVNYYWRKDI